MFLFAFNQIIPLAALLAVQQSVVVTFGASLTTTTDSNIPDYSKYFNYTNNDDNAIIIFGNFMDNCLFWQLYQISDLQQRYLIYGNVVNSSVALSPFFFNSSNNNKLISDYLTSSCSFSIYAPRRWNLAVNFSNPSCDDDNWPIDSFLKIWDGSHQTQKSLLFEVPSVNARCSSTQFYSSSNVLSFAIFSGPADVDSTFNFTVSVVAVDLRSTPLMGGKSFYTPIITPFVLFSLAAVVVLIEGKMMQRRSYFFSLCREFLSCSCCPSREVTMVRRHSAYAVPALSIELPSTNGGGELSSHRNLPDDSTNDNSLNQPPPTYSDLAIVSTTITPQQDSNTTTYSLRMRDIPISGEFNNNFKTNIIIISSSSEVGLPEYHEVINEATQLGEAHLPPVDINRDKF